MGKDGWDRDTLKLCSETEGWRTGRSTDTDTEAIQDYVCIARCEGEKVGRSSLPVEHAKSDKCVRVGTEPAPPPKI